MVCTECDGNGYLARIAVWVLCVACLGTGEAFVDALEDYSHLWQDEGGGEG